MTHTCVRVQPNEIPGRRNPEESRLPARANHKTFANGSKHQRSCLAHASKFFFCMPFGRGGTLRASDRGRSALPTRIRKPQTPKTFLPACLLPTACDYNELDCFDPLVAVSTESISRPYTPTPSALCTAQGAQEVRMIKRLRSPVRVKRTRATGISSFFRFSPPFVLFIPRAPRLQASSSREILNMHAGQ